MDETKILDCVTDLSHAVAKMQELFAKQDDALCRFQEDFRELIKANLEMVRCNAEMAKTLEQCREDYKDMINSYREELHDAKRMYNRVSELYVIAQNKKGNRSTAKSDVNIKL